MNRIFSAVIFILFITMIGLANCYAQTNSTLNKLQGEWIMLFPSEIEIEGTDRYTKEEYTVVVIVQGQRFEGVSPFYLSDEIEAKFDSTKVGKCNEGKYIVSNQKKKRTESYLQHYEIIELTDTFLVYKNLYNNTVSRYRKKQ